jgi:hypothetical protein
VSIVVLFRTTSGTCWACLSDIRDRRPAVIGTVSVGCSERSLDRGADEVDCGAEDEGLDDVAAAAGTPFRGLRMAKIATASTTSPRTASPMPAKRSMCRRRAWWRATRP